MKFSRFGASRRAFQISFTACAILASATIAAAATEWRSYHPVVCQLAGGNASTPINSTYGVVENTTASTYVLLCPVVEDESLDLTGASVQAKVYVSSSATGGAGSGGVDAEPCRLYFTGTGGACATVRNASGAGATMITFTNAQLSGGWNGSIEDGYYMRVSLGVNVITNLLYGVFVYQ
jgi:hypothetical protein